MEPDNRFHGTPQLGEYWNNFDGNTSQYSVNTDRSYELNNSLSTQMLQTADDNLYTQPDDPPLSPIPSEFRDMQYQTLENCASTPISVKGRHEYHTQSSSKKKPMQDSKRRSSQQKKMSKSESKQYPHENNLRHYYPPVYPAYPRSAPPKSRHFWGGYAYYPPFAIPFRRGCPCPQCASPYEMEFAADQRSSSTSYRSYTSERSSRAKKRLNYDNASNYSRDYNDSFSAKEVENVSGNLSGFDSLNSNDRRMHDGKDISGADSRVANSFTAAPYQYDQANVYQNKAQFKDNETFKNENDDLIQATDLDDLMRQLFSSDFDSLDTNKEVRPSVAVQKEPQNQSNLQDTATMASEITGLNTQQQLLPNVQSETESSKANTTADQITTAEVSYLSDGTPLVTLKIASEMSSATDVSQAKDNNSSNNYNNLSDFEYVLNASKLGMQEVMNEQSELTAAISNIPDFTEFISELPIFPDNESESKQGINTMTTPKSSDDAIRDWNLRLSSETDRSSKCFDDGGGILICNCDDLMWTFSNPTSDEPKFSDPENDIMLSASKIVDESMITGIKKYSDVSTQTACAEVVMQNKGIQTDFGKQNKSPRVSSRTKCSRPKDKKKPRRSSKTLPKKHNSSAELNTGSSVCSQSSNNTLLTPGVKTEGSNANKTTSNYSRSSRSQTKKVTKQTAVNVPENTTSDPHTIYLANKFLVPEQTEVTCTQLVRGLSPEGHLKEISEVLKPVLEDIKVEIPIEGIEGKTPIGNVKSEIPIGNVEDEIPIGDIVGEIPIEEIQGETAIEDVQGETAIVDVQGETAIENVQGEIPIEDVQGETPIEGVQGETPIKGVGTKTPIEDVESKTPIEDVEGGTPIEDVEDKTPIKDVEDKTPIEYVESDTPIEGVGNGIPIGDVEGKTSIEDVDGKTPIEDVEDKTPIEDVEDKTPIEDVEGKTPIEDVKKMVTSEIVEVVKDEILLTSIDPSKQQNGGKARSDKEIKKIELQEQKHALKVEASTGRARSKCRYALRSLK